jgi:hypothetical protein
MDKFYINTPRIIGTGETQMSELQQSWIEELNRRVQQHQEAGMDRYDAVAQAAADFELNVLVEGDVCRIYQAPDGILVNCWLNEKDGSPSFDNNIDWFTITADEPMLAD